jgi:hypothetical protein
MKKYLVILVGVIILIPLAAHAFSFSDVLNFGANLFHRQAPLTATEIKDDLANAPAQFQTFSAETKYNNWLTAFNNNDLNSVVSDTGNLYFTDAEINYLIAENLASAANPPARDVVVSFADNSIKISGYAMLKNLSGDFYLEAAPTTLKNQLAFKVTKARFDNFYFPAFIAQSILSGQLKTAIDFLYSDPDYQNLNLTVGSGFIQLNYEQ